MSETGLVGPGLLRVHARRAGGQCAPCRATSAEEHLESGVAAGALGCAVCFVLDSMAANVMSNVVSLWYLIAFAAAATYVSRTFAPAAGEPNGLQSRPDAGVVSSGKA